MTFADMFDAAKTADKDFAGRTRKCGIGHYRLHCYNTGIQINIIDSDDLAEMAIINLGDCIRIYRASRPGIILYDICLEYLVTDDIRETIASPFTQVIAECLDYKVA